MAKHSPMTSEFSAPHTSKDCPQEHVDRIYFDKDAKPDHRMADHHITDPNSIAMGRDIHAAHQAQKSQPQTSSSSDGDSGK